MLSRLVDFFVDKTQSKTDDPTCHVQISQCNSLSRPKMLLSTRIMSNLVCVFFGTAIPTSLFFILVMLLSLWYATVGSMVQGVGRIINWCDVRIM